jgi:peptide/nickel transport system substrate-binding protein
LKRNKIIFTLLLMFTLLINPFQSNHSASAADPSVLKVGWTTEPDSLSPFITYRQATTELFLLVYDSLVSFDNNIEPVGRLAKDWKISDDKLTWTFNIQKDVKWHDGKPFTSEDVKFTYETLQKSGLGLYADFLKGITSIETPDEHTVIIKTEKPKANMLQITTPILPKHIWKDVKIDDLSTWPNDNPVGTGAFKFDEWKKGEYVKLSANKDYFKGSPKLDQVVFSLYANNDTLAQSLKTGELDAAININANQLKVLEKMENIKAITNPTHGFTELAINTWADPSSKGNPLLKNEDIRQAMEFAIDKEKVINVAYSGQGKPGTTLVPSSFKDWHYKPSKEELRTYNTEKANELLDKAGMSDTNGDGIREDKSGKPLEFRLYLRSQTTEEVKAGQMISSMLKEVGIGTKVETVDDGVLSDRIYDNANFDLFIWGWGTDVDPTTILRVMSTEQIGNLSDSYYSNKEYDKLLAEQTTLIDDEKRQKMVWDMQKILYKEVPYIILLEENAMQAVRTDKWQGWKEVEGSYLFAFNNYNYLHVEPKQEAVAGTSTSGEEGQASSANHLLWIVPVIGVVAVVLFMRRRRSAGIDDFKDA